MTMLNLANGGNFVFAIDTSTGIPSESIMTIHRIILTNLKSLTAFTARVIMFDIDVIADRTLTPENIDTFSDMEWVGGCGTNIDPVLEHMKQDDEVIVITDGYLYSYSKLEEIKERVTLVLHRNHFNPDIDFKKVVISDI